MYDKLLDMYIITISSGSSDSNCYYHAQSWGRHHMSEQHLEVPFWTAAGKL